MKQYSKYKPAKYEWLPPIPSHWQELFMQQISSERKVKNDGMQESLVLSLSYGNIIRKKNVDTGLVAKDLSTYQIVEPNNIILRFTDLQNDHKSLRTGLVKEKGIITSAYTCIVPKVNAAYLHYVLHSYDTRKVFYGMGGGVRQSIGFSDIRHMFIPVPPKDEQDQIVRYLDWKVSNINRLIHGYQRQIDFLEERKRSFAFNAVTQGLQANSVKTESPLYWLESIPAHWDTNSIAQLFTEVKNKNKGMQENNLLSLSYGTIKRRNIDATEGLLPASFEGYNIIEKDDIVLRLTDLQNDHKSLRTGIATERGIITSAYLTIRNKSDNNPEFLQLFLHAFDLAKGFYNVGVSGVRQSLNWDTVKMLKVLIPPIAEQNQIVGAIKSEYEKIGTAIESVKQQIELLREYRTRLISDVVTGQVDVRDVEIPDYTPEEDNAMDEEINDTQEVTDHAD